MQRRLRHAGYEVETYSSGQELLDRPPDESKPSCILLDIHIPDLSGPELQQRLKDRGSTLPIVFLSGHADVQTTVRTIKAGADDVLSKPVDSKTLLKTIEDAITRHEGLRKHQGTLDAYRTLLATLTPRERQVFDLVVRGKMNKQIAHELGTTERTIKAHRLRVMEKMQAESVAQLVSIAERSGILRHTDGDVPTIRP